eukprot:4750978-Amphidinium_carterae.4
MMSEDRDAHTGIPYSSLDNPALAKSVSVHPRKTVQDFPHRLATVFLVQICDILCKMGSRLKPSSQLAQGRFEQFEPAMRIAWKPRSSA